MRAKTVAFTSSNPDTQPPGFRNTLKNKQANCYHSVTDGQQRSR